MPKLFGGTLRIGLSKHGVCMVQTAGAWSKETKVLVDQQHDASAAATLAQLLQVCSQALSGTKCAGMPVSVVWDDAWARLFMVTPPQNTAHLKDCVAAAGMRFQSLYGEPSSGWQIEADWSVQQPFLACAVPQPLLAGLQAWAVDCKLHLVSVKPQFLAVWNVVCATFPANAWLGLVHQGVLTLGVIAQHRLCAVRATQISSDEQGSEWLCSHMAREALRLNLPVPAQLCLWGRYPARWVNANAPTADTALGIVALPGEVPAVDGDKVSAAQGLARVGQRG